MLKKKIIVIPLDERPCNYDFNIFMSRETPYEILSPPRSLMGNKKIPGQCNLIIDWLKKEAKDAQGLIVSLDTLLYGGIVPSRLHNHSIDELKAKLEVLRQIKKENEKLVIYGFQLLMRNPKYSSSEEEPDYYAEYGREIHLFGVYQHKKELGIITKKELQSLKKLEAYIPKMYLDDYLSRRNKNTLMNEYFINLVRDEIIDFALIPQDDSSPYGFTAIDQFKTRKMIEDKNLETKIYMYPGADEVANTLLSRLILSLENKKPLVYLKYSSVNAASIIPLYEDRYLGETIKYQVLAAGGLLIDDLQNADIVLLVNAPSTNMKEAKDIHHRTIEYDSFRTLIEFVEFTDYAIEILNKPVILADVAYANGGDYHLFKLLKQKNLLFRLSAYAGWNTSSNSLGTAIPQGVLAWLYPDRQANLDFLGLRYVEDIGYCSLVRSKVSKMLKPPLDYYNLDGCKGSVVTSIKKELDNFIHKNFITLKPVITNIYSPWNRMFEIGLNIKVEKVNKEWG